ncbi:MAG: hypothetical protein LBD49_03925 [Oscillospiraceae bacterium]|jgi:hypothetical protein|nr:hypothetical protein [Oscillospiraceae bacterium]
MSDGNTYESPIVHAIDGEEGAELLAEVESSCHTVYCASGVIHSPHAPGPCASPVEEYCAASSSYCSVQYTF